MNDLLASAVDEVKATLDWIGAQMASLTPDELIAFRQGPLFELRDAVGKVDAEIVCVFSNHKVDVSYGGFVWFPTRTKSAERWDAEALVSLMSARAADWYWDRESGEAVPPPVLAERVVVATARACGAMAPSHGFRVKALESEFGLDKQTVNRHRTSEPGSPTIGRREARPSDLSEAA